MLRGSITEAAGELLRVQHTANEVELSRRALWQGRVVALGQIVETRPIQEGAICRGCTTRPPGRAEAAPGRSVDVPNESVSAETWNELSAGQRQRVPRRCQSDLQKSIVSIVHPTARDICRHR